VVTALADAVLHGIRAAPACDVAQIGRLEGAVTKLCNPRRPVSIAGCVLIVGGLTLMLATAVDAAPLTLKEAVQRALAFAPTVAAATAQSDLSTAMVHEARAPLYPSLSAGSEYFQAPGYSLAIANGGLSDAMLMLNYTAYDFGRRLAAARAALYQSEADRYGVGAARVQIVFDTTVAYYDLVRARAAERELASNAARLARYVKVVEALRQSGRAIPNDVLRIRTASNNAALAISSARHAALRASAALGALMGELGPADVSVAEVSGVPAWPGDDLSHNPILEAAHRRVASAKAAVQAAMRERYPTVRLALTAGWEGINPPHTFTHNAGASYDGLVSMPIFDGGLISAHIDEARARVAAADAQVRQVEFDLRRRLSDADARYKAARDQLALLAHAQPPADDNFALAWARFLGGGNVTLLEVMDAYQQAEQLRLQRFDQQFAARQAAGEAALLLGVDQ
jgi:outer membrane protein TolC